MKALERGSTTRTPLGQLKLSLPGLTTRRLLWTRFCTHGLPFCTPPHAAPCIPSPGPTITSSSCTYSYAPLDRLLGDRARAGVRMPHVPCPRVTACVLTWACSPPRGVLGGGPQQSRSTRDTKRERWGQKIGFRSVRKGRVCVRTRFPAAFRAHRRSAGYRAGCKHFKDI